MTGKGRTAGGFREESTGAKERRIRRLQPLHCPRTVIMWSSSKQQLVSMRAVRCKAMVLLTKTGSLCRQRERRRKDSSRAGTPCPCWHPEGRDAGGEGAHVPDGADKVCEHERPEAGPRPAKRELLIHICTLRAPLFSPVMVEQCTSTSQCCWWQILPRGR